MASYGLPFSCHVNASLFIELIFFTCFHYFVFRSTKFQYIDNVQRTINKILIFFKCYLTCWNWERKRDTNSESMISHCAKSASQTQSQIITISSIFSRLMILSYDSSATQTFFHSKLRKFIFLISFAPFPFVTVQINSIDQSIDNFHSFKYKPLFKISRKNSNEN